MTQGQHAKYIDFVDEHDPLRDEDSEPVMWTLHDVFYYPAVPGTMFEPAEPAYVEWRWHVCEASPVLKMSDECYERAEAYVRGEFES